MFDKELMLDAYFGYAIQDPEKYEDYKSRIDIF